MVKLKLAKPKSSQESQDGSVEKEAQEYLDLQNQIKELTAKQGEIKGRLKNAVEERGTKDYQGNIVLKLGKILLTNQARTSVSLVEEKATAMLKAKKIWDDCTTVEIDMKKVEKAVADNKISLDELNEISEKKIIYAFYCKGE